MSFFFWPRIQSRLLHFILWPCSLSLLCLCFVTARFWGVQAGFVIYPSIWSFQLLKLKWFYRFYKSLCMYNLYFINYKSAYFTSILYIYKIKIIFILKLTLYISGNNIRANVLSLVPQNRGTWCCCMVLFRIMLTLITWVTEGNIFCVFPL